MRETGFEPVMGLPPLDPKSSTSEHHQTSSSRQRLLVAGFAVGIARHGASSVAIVRHRFWSNSAIARPYGHPAAA